MPIGPFSQGILPTGADFAPVMPPAPPAKSGRAISEVAVNANGSLVSFLPPVSDWYSPALQTPTVQTTAQQATVEHPCQGGGECGCGGKCGNSSSIIGKEITSELPVPAASNPTSQENITSAQVRQATLNNRLRISDGGTSDMTVELLPPINAIRLSDGSTDVPAKLAKQLDATCEGNLLSLSCQYSTGINESIMAEVESIGIVRVRINDSTQGRNILDIRYRSVMGNWTIYGRPVGQVGSVSLAQFALGAWLSMYVARTRVALDNVPTSPVVPGTGASIQGSRVNPPASYHKGASPQGGGGGNIKILPLTCIPNAGPCITHDLVCSFPEIPIPELGFTGPMIGGLEGDKKTLIFFGMPCIPPVEVNIGNCCYQHDIAYWCSKTSAEKSSADATVAKCIAGLLLNAILNAYDNFWSLLCMGLVTFFAPELTLGTLFDFPIVYAETSALIAAMLATVPWNASNPIFGANADHALSCLCGGNLPTTPCDDSYSGIDQPNPLGGKLCRDLCKENTQLTTEAESCYNCGWKCLYMNGKNTGVIFDTGTNNADQGNCCPGTGQCCTGDYMPPTCPSCYNCYWYCDSGVGWMVQTDPSGNNLPCCNASGQLERTRQGFVPDPYPPRPTTPCHAPPPPGFGEHR